MTNNDPRGGTANIAYLPQRHHLDRRAADLAEALEGPPDDLLTTAALAQWLGVSPAWLEIARSRGYGPKFVRLSPRRVRYSRRAVLAWLDERTHRATREYTL